MPPLLATVSKSISNSSTEDPLTPSERLLVGYVRKAHGLKGEVVVRLTTNREERVAKGALLYAGEDELVVKSSRPKDKDWLVLFEGVTAREGADPLAGTELFADVLEDPDELWVHELIGCRLVDQHGTDHGEITAVHANPASDLLELESEALVPMTFVDNVDTEAKTVSASVPDGLFDL